MLHIETFDYDKGHRTPWHEHSTGQLYWLTRGIMTIEMEDRQWTVTPGTLGWFPPGCRHCARVPGALAGKGLYLTHEDSALFPARAGIYSADRFVLSLLARANPTDSPEYQGSLLTVLGTEISRLPPLPLQLQLPTDRRARNVAESLLARPEMSDDQTELAGQWGLSVRTLSRLFRQQTGLSFSQWRQQAKVVSSLQWVMAGLPVSEIAARSGYNNVSAYIEVFRARFGVTPGQFRDKHSYVEDFSGVI